MKVLNPTNHGVLDYAAVALFLLAPSIWDMSSTAAGLSYAVGVIHFAMSALTRYPLGIIKTIPFPTHGVIEVILAVGFLVLPWLAGFTDDVAGRNFFVASGAVLFGIWMITDYRGSTIAASTEIPTPFRRAG